MRIDLKFRCSMCGEPYKNPIRAIRCELRGSPDPKDYPIGLMHGYHRHDRFMVMCIGKTYVWECGRYQKYNNHKLHSILWACRDHSIGNTVGEEYCGGDFLPKDPKEYAKYHHIKPEDMQTYQFAEMVEYLLSNGIQPRYYDQNGTLHEYHLTEKWDT